MNISSHPFLYQLVLTLVVSAGLIGCGGQEDRTGEDDLIVVESNIPGMYFEMPSVRGLPETSIEQDNVHIDDMNKEAKRLLDSLRGQVVTSCFLSTIPRRFPFHRQVPIAYARKASQSVFSLSEGG